MQDIWKGLTTARRVLVTAAGLLVAAALLGIVYYVQQADYRVLFAGLPPDEVGALTAKLEARGVTYRLAAGGSTILVPVEQVQQVRVALAADGLPSRGGKGFELFDESPLGMTPFVQNVNYLRALQAELARSIMQLEPVSFARVLIARPEPSPFLREQKPATASVTLQLKPGATLTRGAAASIVALVARGVEGLAPENVTLVDSKGRTLSEHHGPDSDAAPGSHLEYRRDLERDLAAKAEEMLAKTLGYGRAIVRITADVNFKRVKEKRERYSPEDRAVSFEKVTSGKTNSGNSGARGIPGVASNTGRTTGASGGNGGGGNSTQEETETQYLVSKSTQELEDRMGTIERLSIAALVDLNGQDGASSPILSKEEVEDIIKRAVGFNKDRKDEIKVSNVHLASPIDLSVGDEGASNLKQVEAVVTIARNVSLGLSALLALLLGLLFLRRVKPRARVAPAPVPPNAPVVAAAETEARDTFLFTARRDPALVAKLLVSMIESV
jgi:flagellar M-ring protein FliF